MEDVLEVYTQPYDPQRPQIGMDETSKQLLADVLEPLPMLPGKHERMDYEYEREGVADLFMFFALLAGKRYVKVTDHRTRKDWAEAMRELADVIYPHARRPFRPLNRLQKCALWSMPVPRAPDYLSVQYLDP